MVENVRKIDRISPIVFGGLWLFPKNVRIMAHFLWLWCALLKYKVIVVLGFVHIHHLICFFNWVNKVFRSGEISLCQLFWERDIKVHCLIRLLVDWRVKMHGWIKVACIIEYLRLEYWGVLITYRPLTVTLRLHKCLINTVLATSDILLIQHNLTITRWLMLTHKVLIF